MGVGRKQDEALTVKQLWIVGKITEKDWNRSQSKEKKKEIESVVSFRIIGFCILLSVEEMPLIVIEGMLAFWEETRAHRMPT